MAWNNVTVGHNAELLSLARCGKAWYTVVTDSSVPMSLAGDKAVRNGSGAGNGRSFVNIW